MSESTTCTNMAGPNTIGIKSVPWFLYMIQTRGGRIYTGITTNIERRFAEHAAGKGAKFFRTDPPVKIVYRAQFADRSAASKEEVRIKRLSRVAKLQLLTAVITDCD